MLQEVLTHPVIISIFIVVIAFLLKLMTRRVAKHKASKKALDTRHVSHSISHFVNLVAVIALLVLWSSDLQNIAFSIAAFAVAIVLALRDFIQSIIGFFYILTTRPFKVGDWIEVEGIIGEVGSIDWVKTTVLELDIHTYQFTRKTVALPNSKLLVSPIKNFNFSKRYVTHKFSIVRKENYDGFALYEQILNQAKGYCAEFYDVAERYNSIIERTLDATISGPDPEIHFSTTELGDFQATFTLFCPTEMALELEHKLTKDFLSMWKKLDFYEQSLSNG